MNVISYNVISYGLENEKDLNELEMDRNGLEKDWNG